MRPIAYPKEDGTNTKFYREKDLKELSVSYGGSKGMNEPTRNIQVCIFTDSDSRKPEHIFYPVTSKELSDIIHNFVYDLPQKE